MAGSATSTSTVKMSSTISQPTAMWPCVVWSTSLSMSTRIKTTVLATEMAMPISKPSRHAPAEQVRGERAQGGRRPGSGRPPRAARSAGPPQIAEIEVQPDAEHQQDDADFGQLRRHLRVGDEAGRLRADEDPGQQVADDRRQAEPLGDQPQHQRSRPGRRKGTPAVHTLRATLRSRNQMVTYSLNSFTRIPTVGIPSTSTTMITRAHVSLPSLSS